LRKTAVHQTSSCASQRAAPREPTPDSKQVQKSTEFRPLEAACFDIPLQRHEKVSRALLGGSQGRRYDNDVFPRSTPSHLEVSPEKTNRSRYGWYSMFPAPWLADYQNLVLMARHSSCATFFRDAKTFKCRSCLLLHAARRSGPDNLYGCRFHWALTPTTPRHPCKLSLEKSPHDSRLTRSLACHSDSILSKDRDCSVRRAPRDERYQLILTTLTEAILFNRSVTILTCDTVENLFWLVAERFVPRFRDVQGLLKSIMGSWKETVFRLAAL